MKIFISWSGDLGKSLAEILRQWLPGVIQAVKPYYSPDDITKGSRWSAEIAKELEESQVGIICVTRDSLNAPWVIFEAGALSKNIDKSRVCPILFDLQPSDVQGPLVQFQLALFEEKEIKKVIKMINDILLANKQEGALDVTVLDSVFDMWWPKLRERVESELQKNPKKGNKSLRSERDLLEEILKLSRVAALNNRHSDRPQKLSSSNISDIIQSFYSLVSDCDSLGLISPTLAISLDKLWNVLHELVVSSRVDVDDDTHTTLHKAQDLIHGEREPTKGKRIRRLLDEKAEKIQVSEDDIPW